MEQHNDIINALKAIRGNDVKKKYDYIVVTQSDNSFEYWCNEKIREGWEVNGGVSTVWNPMTESLIYSQSFIRKTK